MLLVPRRSTGICRSVAAGPFPEIWAYWMNSLITIQESRPHHAGEISREAHGPVVVRDHGISYHANTSWHTASFKSIHNSWSQAPSNVSLKTPNTSFEIFEYSSDTFRYSTDVFGYFQIS